MSMKVSVITVSYNAVKTISDTIRSVLSQDYSNIEYIIIDGGSADGTHSILEQYRDKIAQVIVEKDNGLYDALNKGIGLAGGEVLAFLHADDVFAQTNIVSQYVQQFERSGADAVYADLVYVDRNNPEKIVRKWKSGNYKPGAFQFGWMPPHPTLFVKKNIYLLHGGFQDTHGTAADYEWMLRVIHKNKIALAYLPVIAVRMRAGGLSNNSVKSRLKANAADRRAWIINGLKPRWYTLYLKPLRKIFQFL